ncbi:MAG: 30S ribosomal protein S6 [Bacilli bacterium]
MNKYEIMFIVKAELEEQAVKSVYKDYEALLKSMKANVLVSRELGQKKLAYQIKNSVRGYYFLFNVEADTATITELNRKMRLDESILRHIVIKEDK